MNILVVDDELAIRKVLSTFLEESGNNVRNADNGKSGLDTISEWKPDVILSDIRMPVMDGLQFLKMTRETHDTPFIMITGYADMEVAIEALNSGASFFIHKPVNFYELQAVLNRVEEKLDLERKLEQERAKLIHMARLAEVGTMMSGVAHEINNPITFIQDNISPLRIFSERVEPYLRQLLDGADDKMATDINDYLEETPKIIVSMENGCSRVSAIIKSMSKFTSSGSEKDVMKKVDLNDCVNDALDIIPFNFPVNLDLDLAEGVVFSGNKLEITQVVTNLISNARDALNDTEKKNIQIKTYPNGKFIFLDVKDNGKGISTEKQDRVFSPFFTTKDPGKGTGLGLSISFGIAAATGGDLSFKSDEDQGTVFTLKLPKA